MRRWVVLFGLFLAGCSNRFESAEMKVRYQPPRGVELVGESAGPPRVASFTGGLELRSVQGQPPAIDEAGLAPLFQAVTRAAGLQVAGTVADSRLGSIPAGKVVRWSVRDGGQRSLIYYLPAGDRFLLLRLESPEAGADRRENQFELSLSSLKLLP